MPINWYRLILGWDLPHLGIRMWQCGWWCYRKGIFSCFLFNLLEFYSNAAITMIISSQFTRNTQRKENSSSASPIHCGLISIKKWHYIIGTYYFSILKISESHWLYNVNYKKLEILKVQAWIFGHQLEDIVLKSHENRNWKPKNICPLCGRLCVWGVKKGDLLLLLLLYSWYRFQKRVSRQHWIDFVKLRKKEGSRT